MFTTTPRIERLTALVQADSFNQSAHFLLGQEYLHEGRYMEAVAKFRRVVELNPESAEGWFMMGSAYESVQILKEARTAYGTAVTVGTRLNDAEQISKAKEALQRLES